MNSWPSMCPLDLSNWEVHRSPTEEDLELLGFGDSGAPLGEEHPIEIPDEARLQKIPMGNVGHTSYGFPRDKPNAIYSIVLY